MRVLVIGLAIFGLVLTGCAKTETQEQEPKEEPQKVEVERAMMTVASTAFDAGARIPEKYTGEGENISPPLSWSGGPEGTQEFALICDDPNAPRPEPWVHWVLYKIPAEVTSLAEGNNAGAVEGETSGRGTGYSGPMPPLGHGVHHYHFKIYALDAPLDLGAGVTKTQLLKAMEGHILAEGELIGTYDR